MFRVVYLGLLMFETGELAKAEYACLGGRGLSGYFGAGEEGSGCWEAHWWGWGGEAGIFGGREEEEGVKTLLSNMVARCAWYLMWTRRALEH